MWHCRHPMMTPRFFLQARWFAIALSLCAGLLGLARDAAAADAPPADPMTQRMQACTMCHGREGRATPDGYFPRIAGKPAGYLFNQLVNFRDGRRNNPLMTYLVQYMSDDYLHRIAQYFAAIELPYPPSPSLATDAATLARGQLLAMRGDAARQIPACVQCHGRSLTGREPAIPGLVGLPPDYLLGQLGAWRNGVRRATAPDCMKTIASRLSADDVRAVTVWLAAQTPAAGARPEPASPLALPIECGGLQ